MYRAKIVVFSLCVLAHVFLAQPAAACPDEPLVLGRPDWPSGQVTTAIIDRLIGDGLGCTTTLIDGSINALVTGLMGGDVDLIGEVWIGGQGELWAKAEAEDRGIRLGTVFPDAIQGWYVPRYVIEGNPAQDIVPMAPDLRHVDDLPRYATLFAEAANPDKGVFYNGVAGWEAEIVNTRKLAAYGLDDLFINLRPGTAAALDAAVTTAITRGDPILAYGLEPSWLLGTYDMVRLEEPPFAADAWDALKRGDAGARGVAYPPLEAVVGATVDLPGKASDVTALLWSFALDRTTMNRLLAWMAAEDNRTPEDAAAHFLRTDDRWRDWMEPATAAAVEESLTTSNEAQSWMPRLDLAGPMNDALDRLLEEHGPAFRMVSDHIAYVLTTLENALGYVPWWVMALLATAAMGIRTKRWGFAALLGGLLVLIAFLGLWPLAVQTLALMLLATVAATVIGVPLGILMALAKPVRAVLIPVLDAMQTLPSMVYLIPALMLFGLGKVPALLATLVYATAPMIRLTDLGIRHVDKSLMEAARSFGASRWQTLRDVQLPGALPSILAGLNQTIMLSLSMVVVASLVGAGGLGEDVLLAIQRLDVGRGLQAGIAIVALAVVLDRLSQALAKRSTP